MHLRPYDTRQQTRRKPYEGHIENEDRQAIKASEPLAAYWTVEDLPAMPRFLRELMVQAKARLCVTKILVFGSPARRDCSPTSDYDLAFVLEDTQGWARFVADQHEEASTLLPLDLVHVDQVSAALREEIMASGVILYEK